MPLVDKYDTQSAIELMRQAVDYQGWFDKVSPCPETETSSSLKGMIPMPCLPRHLQAGT